MNKLIDLLYKIASKIPIINKFVSKELLKFLFIGGTSFIIFYSVNNLTLLLIDSIFDYDSKNIRALIVASVYIFAYIVAFIYNFCLSRSWTFGEHLKTIRSTTSINNHVIKFFIVNATNAIVGSIVVTLLDRIGFPPHFTQPGFIALQTIWTYFLYKYWVFK